MYVCISYTACAAVFVFLKLKLKVINYPLPVLRELLKSKKND